MIKQNDKMMTLIRLVMILVVTPTAVKCWEPSKNLEYIKREKLKRTASLAAIGKVALETLLQGTKKLSSRSKRHRRYEKTGDISTAEADFFSVAPTNIRNYSRQYGRTLGKVMMGDIGDRHLLLNSVGDKGNPILEVIESAFTPGQYVDRIIYKKSSE